MANYESTGRFRAGCEKKQKVLTVAEKKEKPKPAAKTKTATKKRPLQNPEQTRHLSLLAHRKPFTLSA
jgi:hypothetical protein